MCNRNCTCSQNEFGRQRQEAKVCEDYTPAQEWKKPAQPSEKGDHQYSVLVGVKNGQGEPIWKTWGTVISDRHVLTNACLLGCDDVYIVRSCYNRDYEVLNVSRVAGDSALCILTLRDAAVPLALTAPPVFNASAATCGHTREQRAERDSSYSSQGCDERSTPDSPSPTLHQQYAGAWMLSERPRRPQRQPRSGSAPTTEHLVAEYPPQFRHPPGQHASAKCSNFEVGGLGSGQAQSPATPVQDYALYTTKCQSPAGKPPAGGPPAHGRSKSPMASFHHQFVSSLRQYPNANPKIASFFPEALELLKNLPPINNESGQRTPLRPSTGCQRQQWASRGNRRINSAGTQHRKPESEEKVTRCMDYEKAKFPQASFHATSAQTNVMMATKQTGCRPRSVAERSQRMLSSKITDVPQRPAAQTGASAANSHRCSSNSSCVSTPAHAALRPPTIANCFEQRYSGAWCRQRPNALRPQSPSPETFVATEYPQQYHEPPTGHGQAKVSNFEVGGLGSGAPFPVAAAHHDYASYSAKCTAAPVQHFSSNQGTPQETGKCECPPDSRSADKRGLARDLVPYHQFGHSEPSSQPSPCCGGCTNPSAWFQQQFMSHLRRCCPQAGGLAPEHSAANCPQGMDFSRQMANMNNCAWRCDNGRRPLSPCSMASHRQSNGCPGNYEMSPACTQRRQPESEEKITRCMDYEKTKRRPRCSKHAISTQTLIKVASKQTACRPVRAAKKKKISFHTKTCQTTPRTVLRKPSITTSTDTCTSGLSTSTSGLSSSESVTSFTVLESLCPPCFACCPRSVMSMLSTYI